MSFRIRRAWFSWTSRPVKRAKHEPVMARLGHPGPDPQPVAVGGADELDLVGVKAEVVQPAQPFGDAVPLVLRVDDDVLGEGGPQPVVPLGDLLGQFERLDVGWQELGGGQVEQLATRPFRRRARRRTPAGRR